VKTGPSVVGVATVVKLNLVVGAGLVAVLGRIGTTATSALTVPGLAAVCGVMIAGVLLMCATSR
jgi:hypothetical protein